MAKKAKPKKREMSEFEKHVREVRKQNRERNEEIVASFVDKVGLIVEKNSQKKIEQSMNSGLAMSTISRLATRKTKNPSARTLISVARLNGRKIKIE
jgi:hypothetical protein